MATFWENSCSFGFRYVSWYMYLIVSLVFSHLGFWSGNVFLIAPFPDLCLLVPFYCMYGWLDFKTLFLVRHRPERLTSNQMVSKLRRRSAWRHKQSIYFFRPRGLVERLYRIKLRMNLDRTIRGMTI